MLCYRRKDFCPSPFYMASALIISIRVWTIFKISVARTTFSRSTFLLRFFFFRAIFCASSFCYSIYLSVVYWYNKDREKAACERVRGKGSLYGYSLQTGYFGSLEKQGAFNVQIAKRETPFRRSDSISAQSKMISLENVGQLCFLLDCQPGDLLEYVRDETEPENQ